MKPTLMHVSLHSLLIGRLPTLLPSKKSDIAFAGSCPEMVQCVPQEHRKNVLDAIDRGIEAHTGKDSFGATQITQYLKTAKQNLTNLNYGQIDGDTVLKTGNGATHSAGTSAHNNNQQPSSRQIA